MFVTKKKHDSPKVTLFFATILDIFVFLLGTTSRGRTLKCRQ